MTQAAAVPSSFAFNCPAYMITPEKVEKGIPGFPADASVIVQERWDNFVIDGGRVSEKQPPPRDAFERGMILTTSHDSPVAVMAPLVARFDLFKTSETYLGRPQFQNKTRSAGTLVYTVGEVARGETSGISWKRLDKTVRVVNKMDRGDPLREVLYAFVHRFLRRDHERKIQHLMKPRGRALFPLQLALTIEDQSLVGSRDYVFENLMRGAASALKLFDLDMILCSVAVAIFGAQEFRVAQKHYKPLLAALDPSLYETYAAEQLQDLGNIIEGADEMMFGDWLPNVFVAGVLHLLEAHRLLGLHNHRELVDPERRQAMAGALDAFGTSRRLLDREDARRYGHDLTQYLMPYMDMMTGALEMAGVKE